MTALASASLLYSPFPVVPVSLRDTQLRLFCVPSSLPVYYVSSFLFLHLFVHVHRALALVDTATEEGIPTALPSLRSYPSSFNYRRVAAAAAADFGNFDILSQQNADVDLRQERHALLEDDERSEGKEQLGGDWETAPSQLGSETPSSYDGGGEEGRDVSGAGGEAQNESRHWGLSGQQTKHGWRAEASRIPDTDGGRLESGREKEGIRHAAVVGWETTRRTPEGEVRGGEEREDAEKRRVRSNQTRSLQPHATTKDSTDETGNRDSAKKRDAEELEEKKKKKKEEKEGRDDDQEKKREEEKEARHSGFAPEKEKMSATSSGEEKRRGQSEVRTVQGTDEDRVMERAEMNDLPLRQLDEAGGGEAYNKRSAVGRDDTKVFFRASPRSNHLYPSCCGEELGRDIRINHASFWPHASFSSFPDAVEIPVHTHSLIYRTFVTGRTYVKLPLSALLRPRNPNRHGEEKQGAKQKQQEGRNEEEEGWYIDSFDEQEKKEEEQEAVRGREDDQRSRRRRQATRADAEGEGSLADAAGHEGRGLLRLGYIRGQGGDAKRTQRETDEKRKGGDSTSEEEASSEYVSLKIEVTEFTLPREGVFLFRWNKPPTFVNYNLRLDVSSPGTYFLPLAKPLANHTSLQQLVDCTYTSSSSSSSSSMAASPSHSPDPQTTKEGIPLSSKQPSSSSWSSPRKLLCRSSSSPDPNGTWSLSSASHSPAPSSSSLTMTSTFLASERLYYLVLASTIDEMAVYKQKVASGSGGASMNVAVSLFFHGEKFLRIHPLLTQDEILELGPTADPGHNGNVHFFRVPSKSRGQPDLDRTEHVHKPLRADDDDDGDFDIGAAHHRISHSSDASTRLANNVKQAYQTPITATVARPSSAFSVSSSSSSSTWVRRREGEEEDENARPYAGKPEEQKEEQTVASLAEELVRERAAEDGEEGLVEPDARGGQDSSGSRSRTGTDKPRGEAADKSEMKKNNNQGERTESVDAYFSRFFFTVPGVDVVNYITPSLSPQDVLSPGNSKRQPTPGIFSSFPSTTTSLRRGIRASPSFLFEWHQVLSVIRPEEANSARPYHLSSSSSSLCPSSDRTRRLGRSLSSFTRKKTERGFPCLSPLRSGKGERRKTKRLHLHRDATPQDTPREGDSSSARGLSQQVGLSSYRKLRSLELPSIGPIACIRVQYGRPGSTFSFGSSSSSLSSSSPASSALFVSPSSSVSPSLLYSRSLAKLGSLEGGPRRRKRKTFQLLHKDKFRLLSSGTKRSDHSSAVDNCAFLPRTLLEMLSKAESYQGEKDMDGVSERGIDGGVSDHNGTRKKKKKKHEASLTPVDEVISSFLGLKPLSPPRANNSSRGGKTQTREAEGGRKWGRGDGRETSSSEPSEEEEEEATEDGEVFSAPPSVEWSVSVPLDAIPFPMRHAVSSITLTWRFVPFLLLEHEQPLPRVPRPTTAAGEEDKETREKRSEKEGYREEAALRRSRPDSKESEKEEHQEVRDHAETIQNQSEANAKRTAQEEIKGGVRKVQEEADQGKREDNRSELEERLSEQNTLKKKKKKKKRKLWLLSQSVEFDRPAAPGPWTFSFYMNHNFNSTALLTTPDSMALRDDSPHLRGNLSDDFSFSSSSLWRRKTAIDEEKRRAARTSSASPLFSSSSSPSLSSSSFSEFFSPSEEERANSVLRVVMRDQTAPDNRTDLFAIVPFYVRRRSCRAALSQLDPGGPHLGLPSSSFGSSSASSLSLSSSSSRGETSLSGDRTHSNFSCRWRVSRRVANSSVNDEAVEADRNASSFLGKFARVLSYFFSPWFFQPYLPSFSLSSLPPIEDGEVRDSGREGEDLNSTRTHRVSHTEKKSGEDEIEKLRKHATASAGGSPMSERTSSTCLQPSPSFSDLYFCSAPILSFLPPSLPFFRPSLLKELSFALATDASGSSLSFPEVLTEIALSPGDVSGGVSIAVQIDAGEIWKTPSMHCQDEDWGSGNREAEVASEEEEDGERFLNRESSSGHSSPSLATRNGKAGRSRESREDQEEGRVSHAVVGGARTRELNASSPFASEGERESFFPYTSHEERGTLPPFPFSNPQPVYTSFNVSRRREEEEEEGAQPLQSESDELYISPSSSSDDSDGRHMLQRGDNSSLSPFHSTVKNKRKSVLMKEENGEKKEKERRSWSRVPSSSRPPVSYFTIDVTIRQNAVPFHHSRRDQPSPFVASHSSSFFSSPLFFHHSWRLPFVCQRLQRTEGPREKEDEEKSLGRRLSSQLAGGAKREKEGEEKGRSGGGEAGPRRGGRQEAEEEEHGHVQPPYLSSLEKAGHVERSEDRSFVYVASTPPTWNLYAGTYVASWKLVEHRRVISKGSFSNPEEAREPHREGENKKADKGDKEANDEQKKSGEGMLDENHGERGGVPTTGAGGDLGTQNTPSRLTADPENRIVEAREATALLEKVNGGRGHSASRSTSARRTEEEKERSFTVNGVEYETLPLSRVYISARVQADEGCEQTCHKGHCWPLTFVDGYRVSYCRCTLGYAGAACEKSVLPGWYIDFLVGILVLSNLAFLFVIKSSLRDFVEATHAHRAQRERLLVVKNNRDERRTESSEEANNKREETRHQEDQEDEESQAGEQRTRETGEDLAVLQDIHEELQRSRDARWRAFLRVMIFGTAMCASAFYHLCFDGDRCFLLLPVIWQRLDCVFSYLSCGVVLVALMSLKSLFLELSVYLVLSSLLAWAMTPTPRDLQTVLCVFLLLTCVLLGLFSLGLPRLWRLRRGEHRRLSSRSFKARRIILRAMALYALRDEEEESDKRGRSGRMPRGGLSEGLSEGEWQQEEGKKEVEGETQDVALSGLCPFPEPPEEQSGDEVEGTKQREQGERRERTRDRKEEEEERFSILTSASTKQAVEGTKTDAGHSFLEARDGRTCSSLVLAFSSTDRPDSGSNESSSSSSSSLVKGGDDRPGCTDTGSTSSKCVHVRSPLRLPQSRPSLPQSPPSVSAGAPGEDDEAFLSAPTPLPPSSSSPSSRRSYCPCLLPPAWMSPFLSVLSPFRSRLVGGGRRRRRGLFDRAFSSLWPSGSCLRRSSECITARFSTLNSFFICMGNRFHVLKKTGMKFRRFVCDFLLVLGARVCEYIASPLYFLLGLLSAVVGVASYMFFETNDNYCFLHTLWHLTIEIAPFFCLLSLKKSSFLQRVSGLKDASSSEGRTVDSYGREGKCPKQVKTGASLGSATCCVSSSSLSRRRREDTGNSRQEEEEDEKSNEVGPLSNSRDKSEEAERKVGEEDDGDTKREISVSDLGGKPSKRSKEEDGTGVTSKGRGRDAEGAEREGREKEESVGWRGTEGDEGKKEVRCAAPKRRGKRERRQHDTDRRSSDVALLTEEEEEEEEEKEKEKRRIGPGETDGGFPVDGQSKGLFIEWEDLLAIVLRMLTEDVKALRMRALTTKEDGRGRLAPSGTSESLASARGENEGSGLAGEKKKKGREERFERRKENSREEEEGEQSFFELKKLSVSLPTDVSSQQVPTKVDEEPKRRRTTRKEAQEEETFLGLPLDDYLTLPARMPPARGSRAPSRRDVCTADASTKRLGVLWPHRVVPQEGFDASLSKGRQFIAPCLLPSSSAETVCSSRAEKIPSCPSLGEAVLPSSFSSASSSSPCETLSENDICSLVSSIFDSHSRTHGRSQVETTRRLNQESGPDRLISSSEKLIEKRETCVWCMLTGRLSPIDIAILQQEILRLRVEKCFSKLLCF